MISFSTETLHFSVSYNLLLLCYILITLRISLLIVTQNNDFGYIFAQIYEKRIVFFHVKKKDEA